MLTPETACIWYVNPIHLIIGLKTLGAQYSPHCSLYFSWPITGKLIICKFESWSGKFADQEYIHVYILVILRAHKNRLSFHKIMGLPAHDMVFIFFTFYYESSIHQSSTVLKMQSWSLTIVATYNLHSSASKIFGFFTSSFFNAGWNKSLSSSSC